MSEVKRYTPSMRVGHMVKDKDGLWNRSQDFDRVTAERDALQALLTAADERNGQLKLALKLALPRVERKLQAAIEENFGIVGNDPEANRLLDVRDSIEAALKP